MTTVQTERKRRSFRVPMDLRQAEILNLFGFLAGSLNHELGGGSASPLLHISVEGEEPPVWMEGLMLRLLPAATVERSRTSRQEILRIHDRFGNI